MYEILREVQYRLDTMTKDKLPCTEYEKQKERSMYTLSKARSRELVLDLLNVQGKIQRY